jgi:hypothetical protein
MGGRDEVGPDPFATVGRLPPPGLGDGCHKPQTSTADVVRAGRTNGGWCRARISDVEPQEVIVVLHFDRAAGSGVDDGVGDEFREHQHRILGVGTAALVEPVSQRLPCHTDHPNITVKVDDHGVAIRGVGAATPSCRWLKLCRCHSACLHERAHCRVAGVWSDEC